MPTLKSKITPKT